MRIIVTGALGHIGSALIRHLAAEIFGAELILIDNLYTQRYCSLFNLPFRYKFIEANARSCILPEHDVVIHLAGYTEPHNHDINWQHNLDATRNIVEQSKRLIFPSTLSVLPEPQNNYSMVKLREEKAVKDHIILRLGNLFGPSPGMRFHTVVSKFCWQAMTGQKLSVWRSAVNQKRPYVDLVDVCRAICFMVNNPHIGTYSITTQTATLSEVIELILKYVPAEVDIVDSPTMNEISQEIDANEIKELGFKFVGSLQAGIHATLSKLGTAFDIRRLQCD